MPGTIQVSVLDIIDVQTSSPGSSKNSIKVAMGKLEYETSDSGDYIFPVTRLRENLIVTLLDVNGNGILHREIETRMIIENGFLDEKLSFNGYGNIQLKMQFVLSDEDRNRIRFLRQSALQKKHEELVNANSFTKSKSIASGLSSLMKTGDTAAPAIPETSLGLSQETKLKTSAEKEPASLIMWKPDTIEKTKNQPSSSDVSLSKKLSEVKKTENVSLVEQEDKGLTKPKRKSIRRSMSETNLSSVRKMISTFEIKVTQDTKIRTAKIQTKAESQLESAVNPEKPVERKRIFEESRVVLEEKSFEKSNTRSESLSKPRRIQSSVLDDERKPNNGVRLKDSQLEKARGSRLWIFPDEAKDLCFESDFGTRHLDLAETKKKTEESTKENIDEKGFRCRSAAKMNNNKWKNIERAKKQRSENSVDSESSRGPVGQVMRALIVAGFAGLVFLTRQRN